MKETSAAKILIPVQNDSVCRACYISVTHKVSLQRCAVLARCLTVCGGPVADATKVRAAACEQLRPAPVEIARGARGFPRLVVDIVALGECITVEVDVELDVDLSSVIARTAGLERDGFGL